MKLVKTNTFQHLLHTENFSVKMNGGLGILHTNHSVIENIFARVGRHLWFENWKVKLEVFLENRNFSKREKKAMTYSIYHFISLVNDYPSLT